MTMQFKSALLVGLSAALAWGTPYPVAAAEAPATAVQTEPGVWQDHDLTFDFMGFTSTYSCDGLASALEGMLSTVGANKSAKVTPFCPRGFGQPDKLASARLKFQSLQPQAPAAGDTKAPASVPGTWRHVEFSGQKPLNLGGMDCELAEQFADKVLPLFQTRNVERRFSCVPHQDSRLSFDLQFDVFAPPPASKH